jgi:hypothetical protein
MDFLAVRGRVSMPLLAEAGFHRNPLAALCAAARQNFGAAPGLHARSEAVLFRAAAPVGLESALGHLEIAAPVWKNGA